MLNHECILVTGACGFIGSHICQALINQGSRVIGVDNFDPFYARSCKENNLAEIRDSDADRRFEHHEVDICRQDSLEALIKATGVTGIIHLAAKAGVRPSIVDPVGYSNTNVVGTQSVLSAASSSGCRRVVCASSSSVYGNNSKVPFAEDDFVNHPISPYAATKLSCELIARSHHHLTKLPIAMLRFFTVFGPRQRPDLAMSLFLSKVSKGEPIQRFGDGTTSRDYTYIGDIVAGVLSAYQHIDNHGYRIWNLGGNHPTTLNEMIETISQVVGKKPKIEEMGMQPGDVEKTWADLSRSKNELDYEPTTSIKGGLIHQWEWMQKHTAQSKT